MIGYIKFNLNEVPIYWNTEEKGNFPKNIFCLVLSKTYLTSNELNSFNLTNFINLNELVIEKNNFNLNNINLSKNINLKKLVFTNDYFNNIDLSKNVNLEELDLNSNHLISIDVTNNIKLKKLDIGDNEITSIDLTKNINLIYLNINENDLTSIDLSKNINLQELILRYNNLEYLDISKCINLFYSDITYNKLKLIDLLNNNYGNLQTLYLGSNNFLSEKIIKRRRIYFLNEHQKENILLKEYFYKSKVNLNKDLINYRKNKIIFCLKCFKPISKNNKINIRKIIYLKQKFSSYCCC